MKKKWIILLLLLVSALVFIGIKFWNVKDSGEQPNTIGLIPVDANFIIEIRDFQRLSEALKHKPDYWVALLSSPSISKLNERMVLLDSLANSNHDIFSVLHNGSVIISVHDVGKNKLGSLMLSPLPEGLKSETLLKTIHNQWGDLELKHRKYENTTIYNVNLSKEQQYSYCVVGRHLVFSSNAFLIEDVIRQSGVKNTLFSDSDFQKVHRTAGEKEMLNVYINLKRLSHILSPIIKKEVLQKHKALSDYASWIALDLSLKENLISLNGFASPQDSTSSYLHHIVGQNEQSFHFESILPENVALFYTQSVTDIKTFRQVRESFLTENYSANYFDTGNKELTKKVHFDLSKLIYELIDSQICYAVSNFNQLDLYQNTYLLINTKSKSNTEEKIEDFLRTYCRATKQSISDYSETIVLDGNKNYNLYRFPQGDWAAHLFGSFYSTVNASYVVVFDNYLIFGRDKASLMRFVHAVLLNKTLEKSPVFQSFKKNLSRKSQASFYCDVSNALPWIFNLINNDAKTSLLSIEEVLKQFSEFTIQQVVSDDMVYHNVLLQHRPYRVEAPRTVWESRLESAMKMKPIIVKNHRTNEKEIIVQDETFNLYLISKSGIVLWEIPLNEKILSDVYAVDAYKNNKTQYLFNTHSKVYLLDRNGNHVGRFPINLSSPASCGIGLFDYDKNRNYRICVPCQDKSLNLYGIDGNLVDGWDFSGTEYALTTPPQHIRNEAKDYIVFHDKYKVYMLNRKGEIRVETKQNFQVSDNNQFWHVPNKEEAKASLTTTNNKGVVYHTYLNGNVDTVFFHNFTPNHYFMFCDFDADGKEDYIFLDNNVLEVYTQNRKKILDYSFNHNITEAPSFYRFSQKDREIGVVDKEASQIYLIKPDGKLHAGFPLLGNSAFSIAFLDENSQSFNLLVGGKGKFLYNYEVK